MPATTILEKEPRAARLRHLQISAWETPDLSRPTWSPFPWFSPKKAWVSRKKVRFLCFFVSLFCAFFGPKKGSVPLFWNFLPTLFSSKLRFFELPNSLCTKKKARVETTPKKHRKRKKHRKGDQGTNCPQHLVECCFFFILRKRSSLAKLSSKASLRLFPDPPFCAFFVSCAFLVSFLPSLSS